MDLLKKIEELKHRIDKFEQLAEDLNENILSKQTAFVGSLVKIKTGGKSKRRKRSKKKKRTKRKKR